MGLGQEMEAVKFVACGLAPVPPQPQLGSLGRAQEASKGSLKPQCDTQTPSLLGILSPSLHTSLTCKALFPVKEILAFTGWGTVLRDFFFFSPKTKIFWCNRPIYTGGHLFCPHEAFQVVKEWGICKGFRTWTPKTKVFSPALTPSSS